MTKPINLLSNSKKEYSITKNDIRVLEESIMKFTEFTAFKDAIYNYEYIRNGIGAVNLQILIEKPLKELMENYNDNIPGVINKIRNSLIFNEVVSDIKGKLSFSEYRYVVISFLDNDVMYMIKDIKNQRRCYSE